MDKASKILFASLVVFICISVIATYVRIMIHKDFSTVDDLEHVSAEPVTTIPIAQ